MLSLRIALLSGALALSALPFTAQNLAVSSAPSPSHAMADSWHNLSAIAPHTHIHVAADKGGATCYFIAVDDQNLTCGRHNGSDKGRHVFPRADVKNIKLTRYAVSSLGGAAIGAGTGAIIGVATSRGDSSFINLNGLYRAACAVTGAFGGAVVGGATDMFRGPTIYRRTR